MTSGNAHPLHHEAERLLRLPLGADLLRRWSPASVDDEQAFASFARTVLALLRENPSTARQLVERVASARAVNGEHRHARLVRLRAHAAKARGELQVALEEYARAATYFRAHGDEAEYARTVIGWADALALAGRTREALALVEHEALSAGRLDPEARARLQGTAATVHYHAGRFDAARSLYRRALGRARRRHQAVDVAVCTFNLGNLDLLGGRAGIAERTYRRALEGFEKAGLTLSALQCHYAIAAARLHQGDWPFAIEEFDRVAEQLRERGDRRGAAAVDHDAAELLGSLGADPLAEIHARRARADFAAMGLLPEQARAAALHGRLLARLGRLHDAARRLEEAGAAFASMGRDDVTDRLHLDRIALSIEQGRIEGLGDESARLLRRAKAARDRVLVARCEELLAEWALRAGRPAVALAHARKAVDATRRPALRALRPRRILLQARAHAACGHRKAALRTAEQAVTTLERVVRRSGADAAVLGLGHARRRLVVNAVEIVLACAGEDAAARAVALLMRAHVVEVVDDLLRGRRRAVDADLAAAIARLRDRLLADAQGAPDVRAGALHGEIDRIERRLRARNVAVTTNRALVTSRGAAADWSRACGHRPVVVFDRHDDRWRAFVVRSNAPVRVIELPQAAVALRESWIPLRMMLEAIAHTPARARASFLDRTQGEARAALSRLYEAFWVPLLEALADTRGMVVVGTGVVAGVALEAAWIEAEPAHAPRIARIPHPALLITNAPRTRRHALLVEGQARGARREIERIGSRLRGAGFTIEQENTRAGFAPDRDACGVIHVAAHGSYHRSRWISNGLRLRDGWLGFEHLHPRRVAGALLYFDSCESGLANEAPGAELDGWATAGFAAGAHELVLNLWKVDDRSAERFADAFYGSWCAGQTTTDALHEARLRVRERFPHPFHWAGAVVDSRRPFVRRDPR